MKMLLFLCIVAAAVFFVPFFNQEAEAGFLYSLVNENGNANRIYGFSVNESTGALTLLPGFPVSTGGNGANGVSSEELFYDSANGRLYAVNSGTPSVSAFSVNRWTGALTPLFSPISLPSGKEWECVSVHPSGSPLVVGEGYNGRVASYVITPTSATPAPGSPYTTNTAKPYSIAFSRDGKYVYTGGNIGNYLAGFSVNVSTGELTALSGSPFDSGNDAPIAYATDTSGRLFTAYLSNEQVGVFTTSSGIPSPVSGNPFSSGLSQGVQGVLHPSGFYMVADRSGNKVGVYRISGTGAGTTLTAVSGSPFASTGSVTDALALNSTGTFLFAANGGSRNLTTFTVNTTTGGLSGATTQPDNTLGITGIIMGIAYTSSLTVWEGTVSFSSSITSLSEDTPGNIKLMKSARTFTGTMELYVGENGLVPNEEGCYLKFLGNDGTTICIHDIAAISSESIKSKSEKALLIGSGSFMTTVEGNQVTGMAYVDTTGTLKEDSSNDLISISLSGKIAGGVDAEAVFSGTFRATLAK